MSSSEQDSNPTSAALAPDPETSHETDDNFTNSSDSDSNSDNKHDVVVVEKRNTLASKMLIFIKEILLMVFIAATYASLSNVNPPKVSNSPAAYPFFPKDSLISDWYRGQVTEAIEQARHSDIAFVMFYAPWNAESQGLRKQLEITASFLSDKIKFAAINCWQPLSECKRQYSKVYKWPVLIAYPTHGRGIQYNGPLEAFHMVAFLNNICKPIIRIKKVDDLFGKYDNIVLAKINVLPGSREYAVFYTTALQFLEKDPFRDTVFAVIPQSRSTPSQLTLHIWNSTLIYEGDWNMENLSFWIVKKLRKICSWLMPSGTKSLSLAGLLQPGPTLILFTPKNPLLEQIDNFNMLREVAYEYYNCANNTQNFYKQKLIEYERQNNYEKYQNLRQTCAIQSQASIVTTASNLWTNISFEDKCRCSRFRAFNQVETLLQCGECKDYMMSEMYAQQIFERKTEKSVNITGLYCRTNLTLSFMALDSLQFYHFAEKLGLDLLSLKDASAIVIINEKEETNFLMHSELNSANLKRFILNFTKSKLERSLLSQTQITSPTTHVYPTQNQSTDSLILVNELTSNTFAKTILQTHKAFLVFYYSKQCSFCQGISYVFLTLAKMLQNIPSLAFARIDGDSNLLPWEYTMESYPTILFFPAYKKAESRAFPKNMVITVPNLLGFILANAETSLKLKTLWAICSFTKFKNENTKCISVLRMETLTIIDKTLKEWRNSHQKQHALYKIQMLRHLHLLLAHSPQKTITIENYLNKLQF